MTAIEDDGPDAAEDAPFDEESERERSEEAPWETQDSPHEGEEGQREDVA
jgi:hypothetical protein